ncbi:MAG: hypothetical protein SGILL_010649 [Bacillariaceae sp.]
MISFSQATSLFLVSAASFQSASATCHSYYYQKGSSSTEYLAYSYDHDDGSCTTNYDRQKLSEGNWVSIYANKDHENTIQVEWRYVYDWGLYKYDQHTAFELCDDITQASQCGAKDAYKSVCNKHYIFYPPTTNDWDDFPKVCVANTDSDGNLLLDNNDEPYGDCSGCSLQDYDARAPEHRLLEQGGRLRGSGLKK